MYKTLELTLDTERTNNTKTNAQNFLVNTNDYESVKVIANIVQDKEQVDLTDATVKLAIRKPDKTIVFQSGTVTAALEGECEFVLETQSYILKGTHVAEVMIYFADEKIVVTRAFAYHVAEGILTDAAIESTSWYQDVNELQLAVQELQVEVDAFIDTAVAETRAEITEVDQRLTSQLADITQDASITVTVGTGGDYPTINAALQYLSRKKLKYDKSGFKAEIMLLSGYVMREQIYVENIDLGFITISSQDTEVLVDATNFANNISETGYGTSGLILQTAAAFTGYRNATLPVINVLFDMQNIGTSGRAMGLVLIYGASAVIGRKKGFKNSVSAGVAVFEGSRLYATDAIIKDNAGNNISVFRGAYALFRGGDASGAGEYGVYCDNACILDAAQAKFNNAGHTAIWASGLSLVSANGSDLSDAGVNGLTADAGSVVDIHLATINNVGQRAVYCDASFVVVKKATILNAGTEALLAANNGIIDARESDMTGAGTYCAYANQGGQIGISGAKAQKVLGTDGLDIRVASGGIITAHNATGGFQGAQPNVMGSNGVIFSHKPTPDSAFVGSTSSRVTWGVENLGGVGSSTIPLPNANAKSIAVTRVNLVQGGDLSAAEMALLTIGKTPLGFSFYCGDSALSAKLSTKNTNVFFTIA